MREKNKKEKTSVNRINKKVQKRETNKKILRVAIAIAILIALFFLVRLTVNEPEDDSYNSFSFFKKGNLWYCDIIIDGKEIYMPFNYHPREVENIHVDHLINSKIMIPNRKEQIVMAVGENETSRAVVGASNIARLAKLNYIKTPIRGGIYNESFKLTNNETNRPFITSCNASSDKMLVVRFISGSENSVRFSDETDNCIILTAIEPEDFRRVADRLTYGLLGVIQN